MDYNISAVISQELRYLTLSNKAKFQSIGTGWWHNYNAHQHPGCFLPNAPGSRGKLFLLGRRIQKFRRQYNLGLARLAIQKLDSERRSRCDRAAFQQSVGRQKLVPHTA